MENLEMKTSECCFKPFYQTPSCPFCTIPKMKNSEFSPKFTRTAIFFTLLNQTPRFSSSEFPILHYTQNRKLGDGKPRSLIRRRGRKLRGFHLRVFCFECSAKWKTQSWKTSEFDQSTSEQISEVFNSDSLVLGMVQNGKLGVENLRKLILQGFQVSENSEFSTSPTG